MSFITVNTLTDYTWLPRNSLHESVLLPAI